MNGVLEAHLVVGVIVALLAVLAVWQRTGRRIALYVLTLQIIIGAVLMAQGARISWIHPALAVVGWGGYMAANAMGRRAAGGRQALIVSAGASLLALAAFAIGMMVWSAQRA